MKKQSVNLPEDLYDWIKEKADRHHISVTAEINVILSEMMESDRGGGGPNAGKPRSNENVG